MEDDNLPKDLLKVCIQNLLQSWDMDERNDLDSLLSQIPDPKDFPDVCASTSQDDSTHDQASTSS